MCNFKKGELFMKIENLKRKKMLYMLILSLMAGASINTMGSTPDKLEQVEESIDNTKHIVNDLNEIYPEVIIDYSKPITEDELNAILETKNPGDKISLYHYINKENGEEEKYLMPNLNKKLQFVRRSLVIDNKTL